MDYFEYRMAAHVTGVDEQAFDALASHREATRVLAENRRGEDRSNQHVVAEMAEV